MSLPTKGWSNVIGSSNRTCLCGSWKKHWEKYCKYAWPLFCSVKGCTGIAEVGAHVQHPLGTSNYIVPMCKSCNQLEGTFSLKEGTTLIRENICGTLSIRRVS